MSDYAAGSHSHKSRLGFRDLLKKYFQKRRREDHRSDEVSDNQASAAPESVHADNPDSGAQQQSHPREASGKPQRAVPSWCEPIDERPRSGRK